MKNIFRPIALVMLVIMLFSVCSLNAFAESIALPGGQIEDGVYTNTGIGIKFQCPKGWHFDVAEEIAKENGISVSELTDESVINRFKEEKKQLTIMAASGEGSGVTPTIKLEYLPLSDEECKEIEERGTESFLTGDMSFALSDSQGNAKVTSSKVETFTFLGEEIPVLRMKMKIFFVFSTEIDFMIFSGNDGYYSLFMTGVDDVSQCLSMFEKI